MDTKRFSEEDLAPGLQANNVQTGNGFKKKEDNLVKKESPNKNPDSNLGKKIITTAGLASAGGAAVGSAAISARDYLGSEDVESTENEVVEEKVVPASKQESTHKIEESVNSNPKSVDEGQHEIYLDDDENPTVWTMEEKGDKSILVNLNPNEDNQADVEIKSLGEGQGNVMEIDVKGDGAPDVRIYTSEDGKVNVEVLDTEQVNILDEESMPSEEPMEEPIAFVSGDPDEMLDEDEIVSADVDENGDLLADEFDDSGIESNVLEEDILNDGGIEFDGTDSMNVDIDMI